MLAEAMYLAAREYASMGMRIFPILENSKQPATASGFYDATTDLDQIAAWWEPGQNVAVYNIATCPDDSGCYVVDCDGAQGLATWEGMKLSLPPPAGAHICVETPSGGRHYWFKGQLHSSVRIATGIDIRGIGGYVLLPPSVIDGRAYRMIS